jgi:hypothetical protein
MQIFVKSLEQTFVVTVGDNATVQDLKAAVEDVEFIPAGTCSPCQPLDVVMLYTTPLPSYGRPFVSF